MEKKGREAETGSDMKKEETEAAAGTCSKRSTLL